MLRERSSFDVVCAAARAINARHGLGRALPFLMVFTDPQRLPDPFASGQRFPRGAAIVFRHFGAEDREAQAARLARLCRRRGLKLLIGADAALARRVRADGVHLPERSGPHARRYKACKPGWIVTVTSHGRAPPRPMDADAIVLSPIFPSASPSAGRPLGVWRARRLVAAATAPVIALGGITAERARALRGLGVAGAAIVSAAAAKT